MRLSLYTLALAALVTCSTSPAETYTPSPSPATFQFQGTVAEAIHPGLGSEQTDSAPANGFSPLPATGRDHSRVVIASKDGAPLLRVNLATSVLEAYAGSSVCALTSKCAGDSDVSGDTVKQSTGLAAAVEAIAPEPPSMILLATGLILVLSTVGGRHVPGKIRLP